VPAATVNSIDGLSLTFEWPLVRVDAQCRRSDALQKLEAQRWLAKYPILRMNDTVAQDNQLSQGDLVRVFGADQVFQCDIDSSMPDQEVNAELGVLPTQLPYNLTHITLSKES
jgi:DNA-directed RNA polymerase subunit H (RpoH/RPB5)